MSDATVTIVTPVLHPGAIAACDAVLAQDFSDWCHVVLDASGGMVDLEAELAPRRQAYGERLLVVAGPASPWGAANAGLEATATPYACVLGQHDSWAPRFLSATIGFLEASERHAGVVAAAGLGRDDVTLAGVAAARRFPGAALLYRRSVLDDIGAYREDLAGPADWEFALRFAAFFAIGLVPEALAGEAAESTGANSLADLRHDLLRADVADGRVGLGLLTNLPVLAGGGDELARLRARVAGLEAANERLAEGFHRMTDALAQLAQALSARDQEQNRLIEALARQNEALLGMGAAAPESGQTAGRGFWSRLFG